MRSNAKLEGNRAQLIVSAAVRSLHAPKLDRQTPLSNELDCVSRRGLFNPRWMKHTKHIESGGSEPRQAVPRRSASIRETDEARTLLQDQLHSLYWWVFNACRIKGFLRAKQLDELPPEQQSNPPVDAAAPAQHDQSP